jgi:preprotein translocase subunit YajC
MRRIVGLAMIVAAVLALSSVASAAKTFYVDPTKGADDGDGSEAKPWKTLAQVAARHMSRVEPGDTILLATGYHGAVSLSGKNQDFITIAAGPNQTPTLSRLDVSGTKWRVKALTISPSFGDKPYEDNIVTLAEGDPNSGEIIIEDCFVYTELDSSKWDADKWKKANSGIFMGRNGKGHIIRNCYVLNTRFGIALCAEDSTCEGNVITNFSADGIRVTRDGQIVRYNVVKNNFVGAQDGDDNHDDGIQCFLFNKGTGTVRRVTVLGNIVINREDDAQKWHNPLQGIGFFDGPLVDFVVTDNVVLTAMWHGVSLYDAQNCRIERNVCWSRWKDNLKPWIQLGGKGKSGGPSPNVVKDNYASSFKLETPGAVAENNKPSTQQIMEQAMAKAHNAICEKFGKYHPVAGYSRLGMTKGKNPDATQTGTDTKTGGETKPKNPRNHP